MADKPERTKVFISYSHQDAEWLNRLRVHLRPLERYCGIDIWDDTKIVPGSKWKEEIKNAIDAAKVAVLLVSADFLASDFIATDELLPLLEAAEKDGAIILPVILSPSRFLKTQGLSHFQAVNNPSKPLIAIKKGEQEAIFLKVAECVEASLVPRSTPTYKSAAKSAARSSPPSTVTVLLEVQDDWGRAVPTAEITLMDLREDFRATKRAKRNGKVSFEQVPCGRRIKVHIEAKGFKRKTATRSLLCDSPTANLGIFRLQGDTSSDDRLMGAAYGALIGAVKGAVWDIESGASKKKKK